MRTQTSGRDQPWRRTIAAVKRVDSEAGHARAVLVSAVLVLTVAVVALSMFFVAYAGVEAGTWPGVFATFADALIIECYQVLMHGWLDSLEPCRNR